MKQFKLLSSAAIALLVLFSCNSGGTESTETTTEDSTTTTVDSTTQTQPQTPPTQALTMLVRHKVANFDKWLPVYEADDSARMSYGLHNFVVGRGINDKNMVLIALHMDDTGKAKQFAMLPSLKASMQKAGVIGAPKIWYAENQWHDTNTDTTTTRVIIDQKVKDWDAWKKAFDSHKQARMDAGLIDRAVSYAVGDPHMVSVVLVVTDMKKATDFMHSKDLKDKMTEAGVEGPPDIFFYHVVKQW